MAWSGWVPLVIALLPAAVSIVCAWIAARAKSQAQHEAASVSLQVEEIRAAYDTRKAFLGRVVDSTEEATKVVVECKLLFEDVPNVTPDYRQFCELQERLLKTGTFLHPRLQLPFQELANALGAARTISILGGDVAVFDEAGPPLDAAAARYLDEYVKWKNDEYRRAVEGADPK